MAIDPETKAAMDANNAEIMAAYERLWEQQAQMAEEQRAQTEGNMYTQLGFHEAGKEAENALMFALEWQKTVNSRAEATAEGIPPPNMDSAMLYTDNGNSDKWEIMGDIFNPPDKGNGS